VQLRNNIWSFAWTLLVDKVWLL